MFLNYSKSMMNLKQFLTFYCEVIMRLQVLRVFAVINHIYPFRQSKLTIILKCGNMELL